ncbi:uncharacterized protein F5147DRAFT_774438 [Suillus discolor]|uniref:Uncharacterized protein n=1 Tax=Suillus discolor TaxID=1912936 RepID=A0A9P7F5C5_9AGAM|nr:uncharacterized protein F5147DRAFT_774438 [Suillus discolor]KAG2107219.1 hypothetical protein F5147DRAFT_774438 [Suillus discolor]
MQRRRGPKPWATAEQQKFLLSLLSKYIICQKAKVYTAFFLNMWVAFEVQWPEHKRAIMGVPLEGDLTAAQTKILTDAKTGLKGALDLSETLNGGDEVSGRAPQEVEVYSQIFYNERVKEEADAAIKAEGITTRGQKLVKRKDLTRTKYAAEDDGIKAQVQERHQEALVNWKKKCELARASFVPEVEQEEKIKAFSKLGAHLDRIFRHLSHKTGGLKFTCIAGGQNPAMGDVVVLDYHLGETEMGDEFLAEYAGFSEVQTAYANFVKLALAHDDKMVASALDAGTIADELADKSDNIFWEGSEEEEEKAAEEEENVRENEELGVINDIELGLNGLYEFDRVMDDQRPMVDSSPAPVTAWTTTVAPTITDDNIVPPTFDQFDISSLDMSAIDDFIASLPPYDPFTSGLDNLDFSFMDDSSDSFDYQYSLPIAHEPTDHILPAFSGYTAMSSNTPLSRSNHLPPATPLASTSSMNVTDSNTFDPLAGLEEEGPCRTTRHHVPSTREHVLNAIRSSSARVHPPVSVDKENNKRRKGNTIGAAPQSRKKQKHA